MRTCVAFVCGTSNERMISSGARGRGTPDGNASAGLVKIRANCESCEQSTAPFASHVQSSNDRRAEKRFWPPLSSGSPVLTSQHRADLDAPDLVRRLRGIEPDRDLLAAPPAR